MPMVIGGRFRVGNMGRFVYTSNGSALSDMQGGIGGFNSSVGSGGGVKGGGDSAPKKPKKPAGGTAGGGGDNFDDVGSVNQGGGWEDVSFLDEGAGTRPEYIDANGNYIPDLDPGYRVWLDLTLKLRKLKQRINAYLRNDIYPRVYVKATHGRPTDVDFKTAQVYVNTADNEVCLFGDGDLRQVCAW